MRELFAEIVPIHTFVLVGGMIGMWAMGAWSGYMIATRRLNRSPNHAPH